MMPDNAVAQALAGAVTLHLRPPAPAVAYEAVVTWETYANGDYKLSTIRKEIMLGGWLNKAGCVFDLRTSPPVLTKPADLESMEEMALRLATLYEWVVVQAAPTGKFLALLNHEALLQTWARLREEIRTTTVAEDQVTTTILDFLDQQLRDPASFLHSLRHDYLYQTLVPDFYDQQLSGEAPGRVRQFANFFDKTALWFQEQVTVQPAEVPGHLTLCLRGTLDTQKTDVATIVELIDKALHLAQPPAGTPPVPASVPAPHFAYEATYVVELATGLHVTSELVVYARAGLLYNKQYTLLISRT